MGQADLVRAYGVLEASPEGGLTKYGYNAGDYISESDGVRMVIDHVFSDNVARVVFETYRTQSKQSLG